MCNFGQKNKNSDNYFSRAFYKIIIAFKYYFYLLPCYIIFLKYLLFIAIALYIKRELYMLCIYVIDVLYLFLIKKNKMQNELCM